MNNSHDKSQYFRMNLLAYFTRGIFYTQRIIFGSKLLRHISPRGYPDYDIETTSETNDAIAKLLAGNAPCMICRLGVLEKEVTERTLDRDSSGYCVSKFFKMIFGFIGPFWWDNSIRININNVAGFFPIDNASLEQFGHLSARDCRESDINGVIWPGERRLKPVLFPNSKTVPIYALEPFFVSNPWTKSLKGRKVLLIHPFIETIRKQYEHRQDLFDDPDFLPEFELVTYKSVVSHGENHTEFASWFDALDHMIADISKIDFDIAIIGAGAYGLSLAAAIKRMGKKAIHFGGATQLLFGIKGRRWEYNVNAYNQKLYRDTWVRPSQSETPPSSNKVEGGCYW